MPAENAIESVVENRKDLPQRRRERREAFVAGDESRITSYGFS
jgi:hypothetical protein